MKEKVRRVKSDKRYWSRRTNKVKCAEILRGTHNFLVRLQIEVRLARDCRA